MSALNKSNSEFNLQDLDAAQLIKAISEHQNNIIKIVLIIGTLIGLAVMFNDQRIKGQGINLKMSQAQVKLNAIKSREEAEDDLDHFESLLPQKLSEIELISLISGYAKSCHVTLTSLTPAGNKEMGLYDLVNISFNVKADDFKTMMLFLRKIERSKYPLRVETWSGSEGAGGENQFAIEINAVVIKK